MGNTCCVFPNAERYASGAADSRSEGRAEQLSECVRCVEIVTGMGCVPGQCPHAEVCDAEGCSVINIKVGLRHEYIPRMQIAMLFSALLQLIQELKHGP